MKKEMILKITKYLAEQSDKIMSDKSLSTKDKLSQMDIVLNTTKFLTDYDKNIEILNKYYYDNRYNNTIEEKE